MRVTASKGIAVQAGSTEDTAVYAHSTNGVGVDARSTKGTALSAISEEGNGIYAKGGPQAYAGYFEGIVMVTGDVQLQNADCAEEFDVLAGSEVAPGTVMVLDGEGRVRTSSGAYDKRVAGVISGAGDFKPGLVLATAARQARSPAHRAVGPRLLPGRCRRRPHRGR